MSISSNDIQRTISPLRFIFWGGLICVFDFSINQFDLVNDFVGIVMITWGVFKLSDIKVHDHYAKALLFTKIVAVLACFDAFYTQFMYEPPSLISSVVGIAAMIGTAVFCVAMRWLSEEANLQRSARSWRTTTLLFVLIYLIPLGLINVAMAVAIAMGTSINIDLGPAGLLLVPVFFVPLGYLFVSTSRMRADAEASLGIDQPDAALDEDSATPPSHQ